MLRILLASLFIPVFLAAPALAEAPACGPHEHLVIEKDPDEGATVKRCVCDADWDADGPQPPCRSTKQPPAGKSKSKTGK